MDNLPIVYVFHPKTDLSEIVKNYRFTQMQAFLSFNLLLEIPAYTNER